MTGKIETKLMAVAAPLFRQTPEKSSVYGAVGFVL